MPSAQLSVREIFCVLVFIFFVDLAFKCLSNILLTLSNLFHISTKVHCSHLFSSVFIKLGCAILFFFIEHVLSVLLQFNFEALYTVRLYTRGLITIGTI